VSQLLQLPGARWVGNPESTEVIEAIRNDNRCIGRSEVLLTIPPRSQLYARSQGESMSHILEAHTVVAKSL